MTGLNKTLLVISVIGFAAGSAVDFGQVTANPSWTMVLPVGASAFGLFLISLMMEKEMAQFDREEAEKRRLCAPAKKPKPNPLRVQDADFRSATNEF